MHMDTYVSSCEDYSGMTFEDAEKLGKKILEAREKSGLDLCAIAQEICVSKSYLIAIEEGRFEKLPAFPFAIGFVRAFATEVGLDASVIAEEFKSIVRPVVIEEETSVEHEAESALIASNNQKKKRGALYGGVAVLMSSISAVYIAFIGGGQQAVYVENVTADKPVELAQVDMRPDEITKLDSSETVRPEPSSIAADQEEFSPADNQFLGVANAADFSEKEMTLAAAEVMLEAREDAWVQVTSDEGILFEGVLRAGDHYVPPMGPTLNLTTSNAGGLALHIGEHDLGVLGAKGVIIENAKIDPESLILRLVETL